jgi:hypothetical protein
MGLRATREWTGPRILNSQANLSIFYQKNLSNEVCCTVRDDYCQHHRFDDVAMTLGEEMTLLLGWALALSV